MPADYRVQFRTDSYTMQYAVCGGLGYLYEIKYNDVIEYDIYNEAGTKIYHIIFER